MQIWKSANTFVLIRKLCWRLHIKMPFSFWDMRTWNMWKVCLQTLCNNKICWKWCPEKFPRGKLPPRSGSGFGLGLALELGQGQFFSGAIFLEPLKISRFLRKFQPSRENNSRILIIKNVKFSGYCFYMNTNI